MSHAMNIECTIYKHANAFKNNYIVNIIIDVCPLHAEFVLNLLRLIKYLVYVTAADDSWGEQAKRHRS